MSKHEIKLACRNYDRTDPIIRGAIKPETIDLSVREHHNVVQMVKEMFAGDCDVAEFSMAEFVYNLSRGEDRFVGIPIFPLRMFRHGFIFCNASSKIKNPEDLRGKKVLLYRLAQTACVWIRGTLVDEYGLSPEGIKWYVPSQGGIDYSSDQLTQEEIHTPDGSVIQFLSRSNEQEHQAFLDSALSEGKVDVLCSAIFPNSFLCGDNRVKRLFSDYKTEEMSYYKRTAIFPIMHVLVARKAVVEEHPDLPVSLFALFSRAKQLAYERLQVEGSHSLAWKDFYVDKEQEFFKVDPWVYGVGKNRHVLKTFLRYAYDLGVCAKKMEPEELFAPNTWELAESQ